MCFKKNIITFIKKIKKNNIIKLIKLPLLLLKKNKLIKINIKRNKNFFIKNFYKKKINYKKNNIIINFNLMYPISTLISKKKINSVLNFKFITLKFNLYKKLYIKNLDIIKKFKQYLCTYLFNLIIFSKLETIILGRYTTYNHKKSIILNIVAADFNIKTNLLVFKKKELILNEKKNYFLKKLFFFKVQSYFISKTFYFYLNHLMLDINKSYKHLKFYVHYKMYLKSKLTANSFVHALHKEINYRIKQITLIPTILVNNNQTFITSVPSKIPTFFINFLYKHH